MGKKLIFTCLLSLELVAAAFAPAGAWQKTNETEVSASYKKCVDWFEKNTNYELNMHYASFKDHVTTQVYDSENGFYKRSGNSYISNSLGIVTIQNDRYRASVDTVNHWIILTNPSPVSGRPVDTEQLSALFSKAKELKKMITDVSVRYRLEFNTNPFYDAFEFELNPNGTLKKMTFFYSKEVKKQEDGDDVAKTKPRTEIEFSGYKLNSVKGNLFSLDKYMKLDGRKVQLAAHYKAYELKDYRFEGK